jgi:uncharacterized protein DUF4124
MREIDFRAEASDVMRFRKQLLFAAAIFASSNAIAEKAIYKCQGTNGTVFSPTPCGNGAKAVAAPTTASDTPAPNDAIQDISDGVADSRCRDDARKQYVEPDTSAIARAERDLSEIQGRSWYSANNPAQAQLMASQDATRVVALRNLIATESARADAVRAESRKRVDEALAQCEEQKRARDAARGP